MDGRKASLNANIWKYYLFEFFSSFLFFFPIFQLFYLARGLTITEIAFLGVIYNIVRIAAELPSGVFADKIGRKYSLMLYALLFTADMLIISVSTSFWMFAVGVSCLAISFAFLSGANTAFFYDTLKELKREKEYEKLWGKVTIISVVPSIIGALLAGFLFSRSMTLPYLLSAVSLGIAFLIALSFTEPSYHKPSQRTGLFSHIKEAVATIRDSEQLSFIVFYTIVIAYAAEYIANYGQIYWKELGVPIVLFGVIVAARSATESLGAYYAGSIRQRLSYSTIFTASLASATVLILCMSYANFYVGIALFVGLFFIAGLMRIINRGYLNHRVRSHHRATVESVIAFTSALVAILFEPVAGKIADLTSIRVSYLVLGLLLTAYLIYYLFYAKQRLVVQSGAMAK